MPLHLIFNFLYKTSRFKALPFQIMAQKNESKQGSDFIKRVQYLLPKQNFYSINITNTFDSPQFHVIMKHGEKIAESSELNTISKP